MRNRPLVGALLWRRVCVVCARAFDQRRAGRPRLTCGAACAEERHARQKPRAHPACQMCGRRHEIERIGAGYLHCPRTEMNFRPAEQLELGK
jgi:hypothetical protein